ncbi:MAG: type II secretion system F family protein [Clostridia bacterium]|nr:type II secretion system F family protein [Clostridia bacterium]MBP6949777.1 type II secretion system F family protein [Clostridia bacterium]
MRKRNSMAADLGRRGVAAFKWIVFAAIPARLASVAFLGSATSGWFVAVPGALLLGVGLARLFHLREGKLLMTQYQHLLGYLSTRLSAGVPLEAALSEAVKPLTEQLGRHNKLIRSLLRLKKNLEAQMSLPEALTSFTREVGLPVCTRDMTMLMLLSRSGGRIDVFVRQSHHDLSAQINMQSEVANERRGQTSEAIILSFIPFFMARFVLGGAVSYSRTTQQDASLFLPLSILYLLAMFAIFILLVLLAPEKSKSGTHRLKRKKERSKHLPKKSRAATWLSRFYLDWLPGQIGMTILTSVQLLADDKENAWTHYMARKVKDLTLGLVIAAVFILSGRVSPFIIALAIISVSVARDVECGSKAAKRRENYRFYYPSAVNSLYILLESGLTFDRALRMVARVNLANRYADDPVANDLNKAVIHLETGYDSVMAANWLADHCPLPEVQAALRLMARYEREGGRDILELIRMQADSGRQLYRDAMRGRAEQRSLLFVFPMAIDLIVVMATVILPAITQMGVLA